MKRDTLDNNSIVDLDLHLSRLPQKEIVTEIKKPVLPIVKVDWDGILLEWSYRLPKGYPTIKDGEFSDPKELAILQELLLEYYDIDGLPPLRVVEREEKAPLKPRTKQDIEQLIDDMNLPPEKLSKLYNVIKTFTMYDPIKSTLLAKTPGLEIQPGMTKKERETVQKRLETKTDAYKRFTKELKSALEDLPASGLLQFQKYLQDGLEGKRELQDFPQTEGAGTFKFPSEIKDQVGKALTEFSTVDEGLKGVGQGEIMMTLVYDNIKQPAGAGDLQIGENKFEIKGYSARLGGEGPKIKTKEVIDKLKTYGIEFKGDGKLTYKGQNATTAAAIGFVGEENPQAAKELFKYLLTATNLDSTFVDSSVGLVDDWTSPSKIDTAWGLANFMRYAEKEGFTAFLAHDYGKGGPNAGNYIYAEGSPVDMAKTLYKNKARFQPFSLGSNTFPRIEYKR